MIVVEKANFTQAHAYLRGQLIVAPKVDVGMWQSQDISDKPLMITRELQGVHMKFAMPRSYPALVEDVKPNLPWAEDHMRERVCGLPLNPPPSSSWWPYAQADNGEHKDSGRFSHTYPERFWPKSAGEEQRLNTGVRYRYGDLGDLVALLRKEPYTRQAYLPVWFPEDTGNVPGVRIPCTLGYHFLFRDGKLTVYYFIRSCDFVRHFRDDVYMALRLAEWVGTKSGLLGDIEEGGLGGDLGNFEMVIPSLHCFDGDIPMLTLQDDQDMNDRLSKAFS